MLLVSGNFSLRVGSVDKKRWRLIQGLNNDPIDLSSATSVVLRMEDIDTGEQKTFSSGGPSPQFIIFGDPVNGEVEFSPEEDDFTSPATWNFYIDVVDVDGSHPVPEEHETRGILVITKKYGA